MKDLIVRPVVLWDLDGTLFDIDHRLPHILCDEPDWHKFHELTPNDKPIEAACMVYRALLSASYVQSIPELYMRTNVLSFILTGRSDRFKQLTESQLGAYNLGYHALYMRPHGDERPSGQLKRSFVEEIRAAGYTPILAFEDEPKTVAMYRSLGIQVFAADDKNWRNGKQWEVKANYDDKQPA